MANIIPILGAIGSLPLMLNEHKGNVDSERGANIGSIRNINDKGNGGLDFQNDSATSFQISNNTGGQNGRRFKAGLSNADLSNAVTGVHITSNALNRLNINSVALDGGQLH